ncbi:hypothetical protein DFH09DRAFT_570373 [Mycena vulgaris]|nr:hypothetical protein DFH09DRAFT_570373 [Mycena vulgaris]
MMFCNGSMCVLIVSTQMVVQSSLYQGFPQPPLDVICRWEEYRVRAFRYSKIFTRELEESWTGCLDGMRMFKNQRPGSNVSQ